MSFQKQKCPHCPGHFSQTVIQRHIYECEMTKPFSCNICNKRFTTSNGVKAHESKEHTAAERQTKYKCRYCEHGSNDKKSIIKHENIHEEGGGPGFRSRSRSRSRSRVMTTATGTISNDNMRRITMPCDRSPSSTKQTKMNSKRSRSVSINWAAARPTAEYINLSSNADDADVTNNNNMDMIGSSEDFLIKLAIINPEHANRLLDQYERSLDNIMRKIRKDTMDVKEYCRKKNIEVCSKPEDDPENMVKEYEAKYGKL